MDNFIRGGDGLSEGVLFENDNQFKVIQIFVLQYENIKLIIQTGAMERRLWWVLTGRRGTSPTSWRS